MQGKYHGSHRGFGLGFCFFKYLSKILSSIHAQAPASWGEASLATPQIHLQLSLIMTTDLFNLCLCWSGQCWGWLDTALAMLPGLIKQPDLLPDSASDPCSSNTQFWFRSLLFQHQILVQISALSTPDSGSDLSSPHTWFCFRSLLSPHLILVQSSALLLGQKMFCQWRVSSVPKSFPGCHPVLPQLPASKGAGRAALCWEIFPVILFPVLLGSACSCVQGGDCPRRHHQPCRSLKQPWNGV